jgi:hypothetical protein
MLKGDVIPRRLGAERCDAPLRFASAEGFYWAALRSLLRTYFSS